MLCHLNIASVIDSFVNFLLLEILVFLSAVSGDRQNFSTLRGILILTDFTGQKLSFTIIPEAGKNTIY